MKFLTHHKNAECRKRKHRGSRPVNPRDPLNLLGLEQQEQERMDLGLSPLPGDSAFSTPVVNCGCEATIAPPSTSTNQSPGSGQLQNVRGRSTRRRGRLSRLHLVPVSRGLSGYFSGAEFKTPPEKRLQYFLADWFQLGSVVCDYGCHGGLLAVALLEKFSDRIGKIEGVDCRRSCILSARCLRQKKMLSPDPPELDYRKLRFLQDNWLLHKPEMAADSYDVVMALGVTRLVHLRCGDEALRQLVVEAHRRLRPGGHLILETQTRNKYLDAVMQLGQPFVARQYRGLRLPPDRIEHLLASVGFPYCCRISCGPRHCRLLLCTKPAGTTPQPIRDTNTSELLRRYGPSLEPPANQRDALGSPNKPDRVVGIVSNQTDSLNLLTNQNQLLEPLENEIEALAKLANENESVMNMNVEQESILMMDQ